MLLGRHEREIAGRVRQTDTGGLRAARLQYATTCQASAILDGSLWKRCTRRGCQAGYRADTMIELVVRGPSNEDTKTGFGGVPSPANRHLICIVSALLACISCHGPERSNPLDPALNRADVVVVADQPH